MSDFMLNFLLIMFLSLPLILALILQLFPYAYKGPLWTLLGFSFFQMLILLLIKTKIPFYALGNFMMIDSLSFYFLFVFFLVFFISSASCFFYFRKEDAIQSYFISRLAALWLLTDLSIIFILISNHLALMWVGMETTTLITAWLIYDKRKKVSLEALWKYLIINTAGIGFAMIGTILLAASAIKISSLSPMDSLMWHHLFANASLLNVSLLKIGFVFMFIGYGTKIGIAPMHTCTPDTYYASPFPVAALFSGFVSTSALYCLLKVILILEVSLPEWVHSILLGFGLFSLVLATLFICFQKSLTRLLAYSSIEQMGLLVISLGLGPKGLIPALWQVLYHSLSKSFAFVCAGQISSFYGSSNIKTMTRTMTRYPLWGMGLMVSFLALMGVPPFPLFFSKILILKEIVLNLSWPIISVIFLCLFIVFIEFMKYLIGISWRNKPQAEDDEEKHIPKSHIGEVLFVSLCLTLLIGLAYFFPLDWMNEIKRELVESR